MAPAHEVSTGSLPKLNDPDFFTHWAELRHRIALGGKSVPGELKRAYANAAAEFHRRANECP